jgi:RNA polymerase sigma-70 factor (ECF subfamily)
VSDQDWLAEQFEQNRAYLREVGYRLLGSRADAEDAVQEAWLRLSRSDAEAIRNLTAWLTTVVSRICLNRLRDRAAHPEDLLGVRVPDATITPDLRSTPSDPAEDAVLADSIGLALIVVLDTLAPAERLAFVLHDMFGLPFDQIAALLDQTPTSARQLASRARRRVRDADVPESPPEPGVQRRVVDAFFAAARRGDFEALVGLLHPTAVLRADGGTLRPEASAIVRGSQAVARRATTFDRPGTTLVPVLADGLPAVVVLQDDAPVSLMVFSVAGHDAADARIRRIDVLLDPERLSRLDPAALRPTGHEPPPSPSAA